MNTTDVLAAYDEKIRRTHEFQGIRVQVEREDGVVRVLSAADGWTGVTFADLDETTAGAAIAAQIERFASEPGSWEWKHYSYDQPADPPARLVAAGFLPEPPEALLVAEIADLDLDVPPPKGVRLLPVEDELGIDALVRVHNQVFGGDHSATGRTLAGRLREQPAAVAAVIAVADGTPISSGRVEFTHGTEFASLWGGGTLASWRGRGVFRALVAHRAALAAAAGFRYVQVDASADSQPVLRRLGFQHLAVTTPFTYPGGGT